MALVNKRTFLAVLLTCNIASCADLITFESLGLVETDSVPNIAGVIFVADVAIQGSPVFAFGTTEGGPGDDTGNSPPFCNEGNIFITNPGGFASNDAIKTIEIIFPKPMSNVSFLVADIDSLANVIVERVVAEAYDANNHLLATVIHVAPTGGGSPGDGDVVPIDFGDVSGIVRLKVENDPPFNPTGATNIGWGIDDVRFDEPTCLLGDVNLDNEINLLDVAPFVEAISSGDYNVKADINQDGLVNLLDVAPFVDLLSGG